MPKRSSKRPKKTRKSFDPNQLAKQIVDQAGSEPPKLLKSQVAAFLGRLGGLKGGRVRAERLTPERRKEIAQSAAEARWRRR